MLQKRNMRLFSSASNPVDRIGKALFKPCLGDRVIYEYFFFAPLQFVSYLSIGHEARRLVTPFPT